MLVCPKCRFENPNTNKFCQSCGTSLTHKTCDKCDTQVPVNAETCQNCGAFTGTVWWAIISKDSDSLAPQMHSQEIFSEVSESGTSNVTQAEVSPIQEPIAADNSDLPQPEISSDTTPVPSGVFSPLSSEEENPETEALQALALELIEDEESTEKIVTPPLSPLPANSGENTRGDNTNSEIPSPTPAVVYLDPQHRYRLLEPQSLQETTAGIKTRYGICVHVLDCQPFQKSLLEALMEQQDNAENFEVPGGSKPSTLPSDSWKALGIPAIAQPYLALKESYRQILPEVHDAWQQDGEAVVLLEDRSGWQLISDLWGSEEIPTLQILYWLDEMAKLWKALEPWHCRQSLLEITNLRVDEDQALGLVRLYPEATDQQLTLQDLGHMWQMLFNQSQRTQFTSLGAVFRQMCTDEIEAIDELQLHLRAIAQEQQPAAPANTQDQDSPVEAPATPPSAVPRKSSLGDPSPSGEDPDLPTVILPMQLLSLDDAGCTDIGLQRPHNEDCFSILTEVKKQESPIGRAVQARGLYILCDGMGGQADGEVASAMAVETLKHYFQQKWHEPLPTEESVCEAIRLANQAIYDINQEKARSGTGRMGTTLVMLLIHNTNVVIAHVGDSRLYRLTRKRGLEQVTGDHDVAQREIKRGVDPEIANSRPDAHQLTQALGPRSDQLVNPDVQFLELNEDTLFVLCSDGLSDNDLVETHWQTHLAPLLSSRANLDQGILQLIELANEHNGHDNITAILIRVKVRPNLEQQQLL